MVNRINITGQRFGRLTALKPTDNRQEQSVVWECLCSCGNIVYRSVRSLKARGISSCGCYQIEIARKRRFPFRERQRGENSPRWRGGKTKNPQGYVLIYKPDHPSASPGGHVLEHRIVMEKKLGRYLKSGEFIHHVNGVRDDNSIENLMIFTSWSDHRNYHNKLNLICDET